MKKSLVALAFGTLALGIAEFVMMAILPYVAGDLHVSIATAGHLISAYALGVCVGPGADFRTSASAQADFADIGMPDDRGQSVRCGCAPATAC